MARCYRGNGLLIAGIVVTLVGLAAAVRETYHLPGYWITIAVGVALLIAGAMRRRRDDDRSDSASTRPS
ncbi:MAG TPA: hypothetical protein VFL90_06885 [Methylomirabilota bacterium]|nr:hypothetical protein [Methylomirabilota bacterium]